MRSLYLAFAIAGAVIPFYSFMQFFAAHGVALPDFVAALFANGAAGGFSADLLITSAVFWVFMFKQQQRGKGPNPIPYIVVNLLIGLSCALPGYLYLRERSNNAA